MPAHISEEDSGDNSAGVIAFQQVWHMIVGYDVFRAVLEAQASQACFKGKKLLLMM